MLPIYRHFQDHVRTAADAQLLWMKQDQEDTLEKLSQGDHLRDKHTVFLEITQEEVTARGL